MTETTTPELTIEQRMELDQAAAWRPEPGATVTGKVVRLHKRDSEYGGHLVITLDTGDGLVAVHAFHGVLKNKVFELKPAIGSRLAIGYQGKVTGKRKDPKTGELTQYHNYTVIDPDAALVADAGIDWNDPDF